MHGDLKTVGLWSLYCATLMLISGFAYVEYPAPEPPRAWVTAEPVAGQAGRFEVVVQVDPPALARLDIPYELGGTAVAGEDFTLGDPKLRVASIPIGESRTAPMVLQPTPRGGSGDDEDLAEEPAEAVVMLKPLDGYVTDPGAARRASRVNIPVTVLRPVKVDPYQVTLAIDGDDRESVAFDEDSPRRTIDFRLDRPAHRAIRLRYRLDGTASRGGDYTVVAAPPDDTLTIKKGESHASLTLERRPLELITKGLGDRKVEVSLKEDPRLRIASSSRWITVTDPKAQVAWSVDPREIDARLGGRVEARLTIKPSIAERVSVRYAVAADPTDLAFAPSDSEHTLTLNPREARSEPQVFTFPPRPLVDGGRKKLTLRPLGIVPPGASDLASLPILEITIAEPIRLAGDLLVILVLNEDLIKERDAVLKEIDVAGKKPAFVGGSPYILAGDKKIYRMASARELDERARFGPNVGAETILNAAARGVARQFGDRARPREIVLVWLDADGKDAGGDERFDGFPNTSWRAIAIGPPGGLLSLLERRLPSDTGRPRVTPKDDVKGLGAMLRALLPRE